MFLAASTAGALVTVTATGAPAGQVGAGDLITLDIRLSATPGQSIQGLGLSVHGYGSNASFVSGAAVGSYLNSVCIGAGSCFGGLANVAGAANGTQRTLAQNSIGAFGPRVQFALSASGSPIAAGTADQGLDNVAGSTMFRVTLQIAPGATDFTLFVDSSYQGDLVNLPAGAVEEAVGQSFLIVVPEPGTALLMGLGLAGLAAAGRRK